MKMGLLVIWYLYLCCAGRVVKTVVFLKSGWMHVYSPWGTHFTACLTFMWSCIVKLGKVIIQLDATMKFYSTQHVSGINMLIIRSTKHLASNPTDVRIQTHANPTPPWFTYKHTMNLHHNTHHHNTKPHGFYFVTVLHTICGSSLLCTPDDGHIDARNMLRWIKLHSRI
jgi:hypothetical protein